MVIQTGQLSLPSKSSAGGNPTGVPSGYVNELLISELAPQYYTLVKLGLVYYLVASGINATAFTGGAAGTPIFGVFNPATSGKDFVSLQTRAGVRTTGTAAVAWDINWWFGPSVLPTGTRTNPFNMYTQQQTGSAMACFVNTAMTGSTALAGGPVPVLSGGLPAATAVTNVGLGEIDSRGVIVISPGNLGALGISGTLTAASMDFAILWAELPS
jgi:hypothetical protein